MKNVYLFQPQYSIQAKNGKSYWLPYSVGSIWSYCNQFDDIKNNFVLKDIFFKREDPKIILDKLKDPVICGFSCYIWNEQYCLGAAQLIKEKYPNCIIEFGGPQASKRMQEKNKFIDTVIISEGEENFLDILRTVLNDEPVKNYYERTRLKSLDFPSPYQSGIFDKIVEQNPDVLWGTILETNRGCPHRCTFCDWGGTTMSKIEQFDLGRVVDDIDWISSHNVEFLFFADANFGIYGERDLEIAKIAKEKFANSKVVETVVQFTKNSTEIIFEIAKVLGDLIYRGITISVQSMNEPTLKAIKRKNLNSNNFKSHMKLAEKYGIKTYTELILPLPEETLESWKEGICQVLEYGQHESIEVWFCQLFGNSDLNSEISRNLYGIKSVKAFNYLTFSKDEEEYDGFREIVELVNETNTMNIDDIVEAYMYFWVILQFHLNGFTQILAKYLRNVENIEYKEIYDLLFDYVKNSDGIVKDCYLDWKKIIYEYLSLGVMPKDKKGHHLELNNSNDYITFIMNRDEILKFLEKAFSNISSIDNKIWEIQKKFIYDTEVDYPIKINSEFDMETWENVETLYEIKNDRDESIRHNLRELKRQCKLKNKIKKISP
jgi:radical SAM superfamily enzyme YgiQ (UPF0313 family)